MFQKSLARHLAAYLFLVLMSFSTVVQASPRSIFGAFPDDETQKLPPVNWIRSRKIDVKHIALDLRFNWDKQQAMGTDTITVAPFNDTDRFTLDAAQMTINSVKTADGKDLKFNYKGGADNEQFLRAFSWDGKELKPAFEVDFTKEQLGRAHHMKLGSAALKSP